MSAPLDITVVVNDLPGLHARQTTFLLARAAAERGHSVHVAGIWDLGWSGQAVQVTRRPFRLGADDAATLAACAQAPVSTVDLGPGRSVLLRTNPGRDEDSAAVHAAGLTLLSLARDRGALVLNDPGVLMAMASKLNTLDLPDIARVPGIVTSDVARARRFVEQADGPCVLKPLVGTRGVGVHLVQQGQTPPLGTPLEDALAQLGGRGPILAQRKVAGSEQGDTRVVLLNGRCLESQGRRAAVRRVPPPADVRSNIAVGGAPAEAIWTPELEAVVDAVGPWLREKGVWLAGLDVISGRVIEVNVFSTGGLFDAVRLEGADFPGAIVQDLERQAADA